jgi:ribonuclease HI
VSQPDANGIDLQRLLEVDPTQMTRDELISLVRRVQSAAGARNQAPAATPPRQPASARPSNAVAGFDYTLLFDGGSLGNPGLGYGSFEIDGPGRGSLMSLKLDFGPNMTNNQAEFQALINGLKELLAIAPQDPADISLAIRGDSQLVIRGLKGEWKIKHPNLQPLFQEARTLLARFGRVDLAWHPRAKSVGAFGH